MAESLTWWAADEVFMKRMGPYKTQVEAWESLVLTDKEQQKQGRVHSLGAHVWPENENKKSRG